MSKFEQYLEAVRNVVINEGDNEEAYKDLISALRDSSDSMDSSLFDVNELNDSLENNNFTIKGNIATHAATGVKFSIKKIIKISDDIADFNDIDASQLKTAEIK